MASSSSNTCSHDGDGDVGCEAVKTLEGGPGMDGTRGGIEGRIPDARAGCGIGRTALRAGGSASALDGRFEKEDGLAGWAANGWAALPSVYTANSRFPVTDVDRARVGLTVFGSAVCCPGGTSPFVDDRLADTDR